MTVRKMMLLTCSLPFLLATGPAQGQTPIPAEISGQMVKGKELELVWKAPDFDGTKGLRLGQSLDETEDGNAGPVLEYVPLAMQKLIKPDSPYTLKLSVVDVQMREMPSGQAKSMIRVEGRLVDAVGKVKAAFSGYASNSSTGNAKDNARLALRTIAYAMAKELFTTDMMKTEKRPAVIVPAAAPATPTPKDPGILVPGKPTAPASPAPSASVPAASATAVAAPVQPVQVPATPVQPVQVPAAPAAKPAAVIPETLPPLFTAETAASMKRGKGLDRVWISPAYDRATGFALGEVRYETDARNDGVDQFLPEGLAGISSPDAPCTLQLRIVDLGTRISGNNGISYTTLSVTGSVTAADGKLLAAFSTRVSVNGVGDSIADFRTAARQVVLAIAKDLK